MTIKKSLRRLAAVTSEIPRVHYREGLESGFVGEYEDAIESFDRVNYITLGTSYWTKKSQFFKACAYDELEQYEKAIEEYEKYLQSEKKDTNAWNNMGAAYTELEKYDDALTCFKKAIEIESKDKNPDEESLEYFWTNKGKSILDKMNESDEDEEIDTKEVEQCLNEILKINSKSYDGLSMQTAVLWMNGKNNDAVENERKLTKIYPDDWECWNGLGTAYSTINNHEEALKNYEKAIKIKPNEDLPWFNKSCALSQMNRVDDALDALFVAISIEPENLLSLSKESDFDNIRNSERFKKYLSIQI